MCFNKHGDTNKERQMRACHCLHHNLLDKVDLVADSLKLNYQNGTAVALAKQTNLGQGEEKAWHPCQT